MVRSLAKGISSYITQQNGTIQNNLYTPIPRKAEITEKNLITLEKALYPIRSQQKSESSKNERWTERTRLDTSKTANAGQLFSYFILLLLIGGVQSDVEEQQFVLPPFLCSLISLRIASQLHQYHIMAEQQLLAAGEPLVIALYCQM